jgi:hypothetical protein
MFCRFCGTHLLDDSLFCSKCGKRQGRAEHPRLAKAVRILLLRTPYPYAVLLFVVAALWLAWPRGEPFDYSDLKWTVEQNRKLDLPEEHLFQQGFSLVLENAGSRVVREVPVELIARIEPPQSAEIAASYLGNRVPIMEHGRTAPLLVILSDEVRPGDKRTFLLEGSIEAQPPFKVTYEFREEDSETILANFVVER